MICALRFTADNRTLIPTYFQEVIFIGIQACPPAADAPINRILMKGRTMLFDRMTRIAIPLALFAACSAAGAAASGPGSGGKGDAEGLVSQAIRYENAEGVPRD